MPSRTHSSSRRSHQPSPDATGIPEANGPWTPARGIAEANDRRDFREQADGKP